MKQVKTKNHGIRFQPTFDEIRAASDNQQGFCIACGEIADQVEPDARNYICESCGFSEVYGAEELVVMGWFYD